MLSCTLRSTGIPNLSFDNQVFSKQFLIKFKTRKQNKLSRTLSDNATQATCPMLERKQPSQSERTLKSFDSIPGPRGLPIVGNLWRYLIGEYSFDRLHATGFKKYRQFGPIVREEILPGVNLLLLYAPEDIERMYQFEGRYPSRRSHSALEKYRLSKPELYNNGGLLPTNGEEWLKMRKSLQRPINTINNVYLNDIDIIAGEFCKLLSRANKEQQIVADFLDNLSLVFVEFLGLVAFDKRLGALENDLTNDSLPMRLIKAACDTNSQILRTDNGLQLWRKWKTPAYSKICESQEYIERIALHFVNEKKGELAQNGRPKKENKTLLEIYLDVDNSDLDTKDVIGFVSDMLLAGIDTSSFTMSFVLYHLARNPIKQEELFSEVKHVIKNKSNPITADMLTELRYLKAVVKESLRLNPISIGVGRILPEDASFSGYHCPANTILVSQNQVSCRLEEFFPEPNSFLPERWIKDSIYHKKANPYLVLPFGHGPRACIARRIAEQNIYVLLAKIVRNFQFTWMAREDLDCTSLLINRPDKPLKFCFTERLE